MSSVFDTDMGPMLICAVLAHSLETGDLIFFHRPVNPVLRPARVTCVRLRGEVAVVWTTDRLNRYIALGVNEPIGRAVGARAGGVL